MTREKEDYFSSENMGVLLRDATDEIARLWQTDPVFFEVLHCDERLFLRHIVAIMDEIHAAKHAELKEKSDE